MTDRPMAINLPALRKLAEKPWLSVAEVGGIHRALPAVVKEIELMRDIVLAACDVVDELDENDEVAEETKDRLDERIEAWLKEGE